MPQQPDDPITDFLRKQGASYAIVANGLRGLVENWERVVDQVMPRVRTADHRMLVLLEPAERCLWGPITAEDEGWTPERNWWYFQVPKSPGPTLQQELQDS